jgi:hypothetical protein
MCFIYRLIVRLFGSKKMSTRIVPFTSIGSIPRIPNTPASTVDVNDWIDLKIDYRPYGDKHAQHVRLQIDFGIMANGAIKFGREQEAREALSHYANLIDCGYIEPLGD